MSLLEMVFSLSNPYFRESCIFPYGTDILGTFFLGRRTEQGQHFSLFQPQHFSSAKTEDSNLPRRGSLRGFTTYQIGTRRGLQRRAKKVGGGRRRHCRAALGSDVGERWLVEKAKLASKMRKQLITNFFISPTGTGA